MKCLHHRAMQCLRHRAMQCLRHGVMKYLHQRAIQCLHAFKRIYKKGDCLDTNNFRGLAIGAAMAKLYSLILLGRLTEHIKFWDLNKWKYKGSCYLF